MFTGSTRAGGWTKAESPLTPGNRALGPGGGRSPCRSWRGPAIDGLPADEQGFIPVDEHGRVKGVEDVYAAGDGTNFPIKQGGLGTQQADAAAEHIAHRLGASETPEPFRPGTARQAADGRRVAAACSTDVAGGGGEGVASADYLWWPPHKISSRYLAPLLHYGDVHGEPEPPGRSLDVEIALPKEWHEEPMALDSDEPPRWTELDAEHGAQREHHDRSRQQAPAAHASQAATAFGAADPRRPVRAWLQRRMQTRRAAATSPSRPI